MEITSIKVKAFDGNDAVKARANIVFDNCFAINSIKIIEGKNGLFVAMPNEKVVRDEEDGRKRQQYYDICCPINSEFRKTITDAILGEYNKVLSK